MLNQPKEFDAYFDPDLALKMAEEWLPLFEGYFRYQSLGMEKLPDRPFLVAGNHNGGVMCVDSYMWVAKYHSLRRTPHLLGLGHDSLKAFSKTKIGRFVAAGGMIRANFDSALQALNAGYALIVYPGGDRDNNRAFAKRNEINFFGHTGYVKLALRARVPIVPLVSVGAHETLFILWEGEELAEKLGVDKKYRSHNFPVSLNLPWGISVGPAPFFPLPAQITTEVLDPVDIIYDYPPEAADDPKVVQLIDRIVQGRMQDALNRLSKDRIPILGKADEVLPKRGEFMGDFLRDIFKTK